MKRHAKPAEGEKNGKSTPVLANASPMVASRPAYRVEKPSASMAPMVSSDLRIRRSVPTRIQKRLRGVRPSSSPPSIPASSRLVPVAEAQLKTKIAGSAEGLATTGGMQGHDVQNWHRMLRRCAQRVAVPAAPLRNVFTGVSPQTNTNAESRIQGIQAFSLRPPV